MNAAAKIFSPSALSRSWAITFFLARAQFSTIILCLSILTSALSVVYVTHLTRSYTGSVQQQLVLRDRMHLQRNELLLEKSTWLKQSHVQQIAEKDLGMVYPDRTTLQIIDTTK